MNFFKKLGGMAGILILVTTLTSCAFMDRLKARDYLNKGVSDYTSKRYEEAIENFRLAIEHDPELTDAYLYLAITYRAQFVPQAKNAENLQVAQRAIDTFERVLQRAPNNKQVAATAMANIAGIYSGLEEHDKAKDWYRKRVELEPENPEPLYGIGTINWELSYNQTGMNGEHVEQLTDEEKESINGLVDEGVEALRKALEISPQYVDAMQYLNLLYREKAKLTEDEAQKREWLRDADRLALESLELRRKQQAEAERARRALFTGKKQE